VQALSGGEQQRVALARALVIAPPVLLLDEPLSNLDPLLRVRMREELRDMLRASRVTALLVTHDQDDAFAVADRIALMEQGRLLQVGTPDALYDRPASRHVATFIGNAALFDARLEGGRCVVTLGDVPQLVDAAPGSARRGLVALRPESLALEAPGVASAASGTVTSRRFAGGAWLHHVRLGDGRVVAVASGRHDPHAATGEGGTTAVRIVAPALFVFPE